MKYTTQNCLDCGVLMERCGVARKRCPECARIAALKQAAEYKKKKRLGIVIPKTTPDRSGKYCEGCDYYYGDSCKTCNYIFITGHRRPCPPGKDCTVKKVRTSNE